MDPTELTDSSGVGREKISRCASEFPECISLYVVEIARNDEQMQRITELAACKPRQLIGHNGWIGTSGPTDRNSEESLILILIHIRILSRVFVLVRRRE